MLLSILNSMGLSTLTDQQIKNLAVFLQIISDAEGTTNRAGYDKDGWDVPQNYKGKFSTNALHPFRKMVGNRCVTRDHDPKKGDWPYQRINGAGPAFGKFQIEPASWCDYGFADKPMTPYNQVDFTLQKIKRRGAFKAVIDGNFSKARTMLAGIWRAFDNNSRYNTGEKITKVAYNLGGRKVL